MVTKKNTKNLIERKITLVDKSDVKYNCSFNNQYVISFNDQSVFPCELYMSPLAKTIKSAAATVLLFTITSNTPWTILVYAPWLTIQSIGSGGQDVYGSVLQNTTGVPRFANVIVSYCDGEFQTFTLIQNN